MATWLDAGRSGSGACEHWRRALDWEDIFARIAAGDTVAAMSLSELLQPGVRYYLVRSRVIPRDQIDDYMQSCIFEIVSSIGRGEVTEADSLPPALLRIVKVKLQGRIDEIVRQTLGRTVQDGSSS